MIHQATQFTLVLDELPNLVRTGNCIFVAKIENWRYLEKGAHTPKTNVRFGINDLELVGKIH